MPMWMPAPPARPPVALSCSSTYEQSVLSPDLFGEGRRWVASSPELEVEVAYFQGEPVAGGERGMGGDSISSLLN